MFGCLPGHIPAGLGFLPDYRAGGLPAVPGVCVPPVVNEGTDGTPWGIDGNDKLGDCGVAGLNHGFMATAAMTGLAGSESWPSTGDVTAYYMTYTGGQDTGVVLADFLAYARREGFFGHSVQAYAPVAVHDMPSLHFTVDAYGFAYTGIRVTGRMLEEFRTGHPWGLGSFVGAPVVGGHCVPVVGFDEKALYVVTWGKVQAVSYPGWHYMATEAWAVITGEVAARGDDGRGISLAALEADLGRLNV